VSGPGGRTLPDISSSGPPLLPICTGAQKSEGTRALCRTMSKSLRLGLALGNPNHLADGPLDRATSDCLQNTHLLHSSRSRGERYQWLSQQLVLASNHRKFVSFVCVLR